MPTGDLLIDTPYGLEVRGELYGFGEGIFLTGPPTGLGNTEQRVEDVPRPLEHGMFTGRAFYGSKAILLPIAVLGDDVDDALDRYFRFAGSWRPLDYYVDGATTELALRLGSRVFVFRGRPGRLGDPDLTLLPKGAAAEAVAEFVATDPRAYEHTERSASTGLGSVSGGLGLPHGFPHGFGVAAGSSILAANDGNFPTYPVITFTAGAGGLINPSVEHVGKGATLEVLIELDAGDTLELDLLERSAILNGTASRSNLIRRPGSTWFALDPAPAVNDLRFAAGGGDGTMLVAWRDAYTFG
jgi:hypothetical protein